MFSNKTLYIPDYVVYEDIPTIIKYFDYYNIAKVKRVDVFKHLEPEYYVEDVSNYGYAYIEIEEYYDNQGARNFYNRIENNKGIIVYNDPYFWEVKFKYYTCVRVPECEVPDCECEVPECEVPDCECEVPECEVPDCEVPECEVPECESLNNDYVYEEESYSDEFSYNNYEQNFNRFKKKQSAKKQKLNEELLEIKKSIQHIDDKQTKLLKLLISNNNVKNKKQNNNYKNKEFKNSWLRRLRHQSL